MANDKNLGHVTAYAYAKSKGYTGTEEEFAELMASYATVAEQAAQSAQQAVAAALQASGSATTAGSKASKAASAAETAQTAKQSAEQAAQDAAQNAQASGDAKTAAETAQTAAVAAQTAAEGARDAAAASAAAAAQSAASADYLSQMPTETASGFIASFTDGADGIPVKDLTVQIVPQQAGSGDPSPDNIRPISGWTGARVLRTGKNLLPKLVVSETKKGVTWTPNANGSVTIEGTATENSIVDFGRGVLLLQPGTYTTNTSSAEIAVAVWRNSNPATLIKNGGGTFTLDSPTEVFVRFYVPTSQAVNTVIYPQLEIGPNATEYEPFGTTYTVSWGSEAGIVYGGTLDVTTGLLTVDRVLDTFNGSSVESVGVGNNVTYAATRRSSAGLSLSNSGAICNAYTPIYDVANPFYGGFYFVSMTSRTTRFFDERFTEIETAKAIFDASPVTICYRITNPTTYQLTPTEVKTLLGVNNIWADCGPVDVEYRADVELYIAKQLAGKVTASDTGIITITDGLSVRNANGVVTVDFHAPYTAADAAAGSYKTLSGSTLPAVYRPLEKIRFPISINGQFAELIINTNGSMQTYATFATTSSMDLRGTITYTR